MVQYNICARVSIICNNPSTLQLHICNTTHVLKSPENSLNYNNLAGTVVSGDVGSRCSTSSTDISAIFIFVTVANPFL